MDEYNSGWDPEVKHYFKKIMKSFSAVVLWLMVMAPLAFFFRLALVDNGWRWTNTVFYVLFTISTAALLWFLAKLWRRSGG